MDIPDSAICIQELTKVALLSSLTLMLAWSPVEAARLRSYFDHFIVFFLNYWSNSLFSIHFSLQSDQSLIRHSHTLYFRYLEAFKIYENKPPEVLQGVKDTSYQGHLNGFLTSIRGVNKTDVARFVDSFSLFS